MNNTFTVAQKDMFLKLARKYDPEVYRIVSRGNRETIEIENDDELAEIELFADKIVGLVGNDYPDADGEDDDINDDAVLAAFLTSRIIQEYKNKNAGGES